MRDILLFHIERFPEARRGVCERVGCREEGIVGVFGTEVISLPGIVKMFVCDRCIEHITDTIALGVKLARRPQILARVISMITDNYPKEEEDNKHDECSVH